MASITNAEEIIVVTATAAEDDNNNRGNLSTSFCNMEDQRVDNSSSNKSSVMMVSKRGILLNVVIHLILFFIAVYVIFRSITRGLTLFSWHPSLMIIGYLIFMTHAILALCDTNYFTYQLGYKSRIELHWILQIASGLTITAAFGAIVANKIRLEKGHFQTFHSILGLITYVLTIVTLISGVGVKFNSKIKSFVRPIMTKISHTSLGILCYLLGIVTIVFGFNSTWFKQTLTLNQLFGLYLLLIFTTSYVMIKPIILLLNRLHGVSYKH